jgi:hypothetical protein
VCKGEGIERVNVLRRGLAKSYQQPDLKTTKKGLLRCFVWGVNNRKLESETAGSQKAPQSRNREIHKTAGNPLGELEPAVDRLDNRGPAGRWSHHSYAVYPTPASACHDLLLQSRQTQNTNISLESECVLQIFPI